MLEISPFRFAMTFSVTSFLIVSTISEEIIIEDLDCGTEPSRDFFPLSVDVRFVKPSDVLLRCHDEHY